MPFVSDNDRSPPELMPLWQRIIRTAPSKPLVIDLNSFPSDSVWGAEMRLDAAHADLAQAREDLAAAVREQDPDRHFLGLQESPEVIAAYDEVRAAEATVARLEKTRRRA